MESLDRAEQANVAGAAGDTAKVIVAVNESGDRNVSENSPLRAESYRNDLSGVDRSNVGNSDFSCNGNGEVSGAVTFTGWEAERAIFLNAERSRRLQVQTQLENVQVDNCVTDGIDSVISGVAAMATIIDDEPAPDEDIDRHTDSKSLAEEIRRKESLGYHMG